MYKQYDICKHDVNISCDKAVIKSMKIIIFNDNNLKIINHVKININSKNILRKNSTNKKRK